MVGVAHLHLGLEMPEIDHPRPQVAADQENAFAPVDGQGVVVDEAEGGEENKG